MGNKGTLLTNGQGQGNRIRVEESDDPNIFPGDIYEVTESSSSGERLYALYDFSLDGETSDLILGDYKHWMSRGEIITNDDGDKVVKVTYVNDSGVSCGEYTATTCSTDLGNPGDRTPAAISPAADTGIQYRFSVDIHNPTGASIDADSIEEDPKDTTDSWTTVCP